MQSSDLTRWILERRPPKHDLDPWRAYGAFVEPEFDADGVVRDVATVLLTNRECPFRCLMCDLWRYTLDDPTPPGAVPRQIAEALAGLPPADNIKLYNAGNFFDSKAIPKSDHTAIIEQVGGFRRVIIESHPRLIGPAALQLRDRLDGRLEVAIGLETAHPQLLATLNKDMTLDDFRAAVRFLRQHDIDVRSFVLLRPPRLSEDEGLAWARRSIDYAFDCGVQCCAVVPTRSGNGALDALAADGLFVEPNVASLEAALEYGLGLGRGRVFADFWDIERFSRCAACGPARRQRLQHMNITQEVPEPLSCQCEARRS